MARKRKSTHPKQSAVAESARIILPKRSKTDPVHVRPLAAVKRDRKEIAAARTRGCGTPREECYGDKSIRGGGVRRVVRPAQPIGDMKLNRETNSGGCASRVELSSSPEVKTYGETKRWPCVVPKMNGRAQTVRSNGVPLLERREEQTVRRVLTVPPMIQAPVVRSYALNLHL